MSATRIRKVEGSTMAKVIGLLLLFGSATVKATSTGGDDGSIPTFSLTELKSLSESNNHRTENFRKALSSNGLLAVQLNDQGRDFLEYPNDRKIALDGLCSCVDHPGFLNLDQTHELTLMDSATGRISVATATVGLDHPLPLPKGMEDTCGETVVDAMEGLRDVVASVSRAFVSAVDGTLLDTAKSSPSPTTLLRDEFGRSFASVSEIVQSANHLEHFHVYTNNAENSSDRTTTSTAWDWHTDAGLFLVFVPAWDCNGGDIDESFYYRDIDGNTVRAKLDGRNTAIVMLGQGAQDWLNLPTPKSTQERSAVLKATTHSVRWSSGGELFIGDNNLPKQRRAWYGMMNLVPETALVYGGKTLREVKQSLSVNHQEKTNFQPSSETSSASEIPLGCGSVPARPHVDRIELELGHVETTSRRRRHLKMQDSSICNNVTNFYCWMTCMDIPEVEQASLYLEADYSLYCVDEPIVKTTGNLASAVEACVDVHNMGCKGVWEKTDLDVQAVTIAVDAIGAGKEIEYPFCYSGTTMYMEGFQWVQSSTCVILLFPGWVLNSAAKYALAVIGTVLLAIGLEKFIQQRRKAMACMEYGTKRLVASAIFYGVQLIIGYVLMLIIMIYSGVLFLSVILGLVIGHVLFNARDALFPIHESSILEDQTTDNSNDDSKDDDGDLGMAIRKGSSSRRSISSIKSEQNEERGLREGSTHCQDFETDNDILEYYGSMELGTDAERKNSKRASRRKTIDQEVAEGSTPCCQHSEA